METLGLIVAIVGSCVGATWALRSQLAKIETAIQGHVAEDAKVHTAQDAKILRLEKRRGSR